MKKVFTKHFQYTGLDDYDMSLDDQINHFLAEEKISPDQIIDLEYAAHSSQGINTYSALLLYTAG
ncbi:sporulation protein Cse60 [Thermophagus sp. OGC60D27]|uniref:sporulation protein Cse60 n=1 Tax=Thermophagus sp. OGC60D27 TaxID=3458415 RepID=UPI0040375FC7